MIGRRAFVTGLAAAGVVGGRKPALAEPPPETTRLRMARIPSICQAPKYMAEDLLRAEGFTDVQYVPKENTLGVQQALATGEIDVDGHFAAPVILRVEAGDPIVVLAGEHVGCFELFAGDRVRTVRELKGKTVAVPDLDPARYAFVASIAAHVGLDPRRDINWVRLPAVESKRLFIEGKVDAYLGFPPDPQELREKKVGRVIVNSAVDRPWAQYFCCLLIGNKEFVRKHPVATKRALRAIFKAADVCAIEPDRVARTLVDKGYASHYEYARQSLRDIPYAKWRALDPEDTLRFYSLRLHEAGMIKSSPQKILAQGADWRFLKQLGQELKG